MCQVPAQHTGTIQGSGTSGYRVNIENASRDFTGVMESSGTVQPALTAIFRLMDILVDPPPPRYALASLPFSVNARSPRAPWKGASHNERFDEGVPGFLPAASA